MYIQDGGKTKNIGDKIERISVYHDNGRKIQLWINTNSLSYLTIDEALELRDELNKSIKKVCNL